MTVTPMNIILLYNAVRVTKALAKLPPPKKKQTNKQTYKPLILDDVICEQTFEESQEQNSTLLVWRYSLFQLRKSPEHQTGSDDDDKVEMK